MELALGALARYGVEGAVARRATAFPWGIVNVSGSFLLGVVFTLLGEPLTVAPWLRAAVAIGFLGAYTSCCASSSANPTAGTASRVIAYRGSHTPS